MIVKATNDIAKIVPKAWVIKMRIASNKARFEKRNDDSVIIGVKWALVYGKDISKNANKIIDLFN